MFVKCLSQLSADSVEWGTAEGVIIRSRCVLGQIDLDPSSSDEFNTRVRASRYYTEEDDGLTMPWRYPGDPPLNVFLNPPGGLVREFWGKLIEEHALGNVKAAIWIGFSLEQLLPLQKAAVNPLTLSTVFPRERIRYVRPGWLAWHKAAASPTHGSYITYLGPDIDRFRAVFKDMGEVINAMEGGCR